MSKKCSKCKKEKDNSLFFKDRSRPDGFAYQCKLCRGEYMRGYSKEYRSTPKGRAALNAGQKRYYARNPYKAKAHTLVNAAIRSKELIKPSSCSECWTPCEPEAHHDDYNKPLDVRWLCSSCHKEWHKSNKAIQHKDNKSGFFPDIQRRADSFNEIYLECAFDQKPGCFEETICLGRQLVNLLVEHEIIEDSYHQIKKDKGYSE